MPATRSIKQIIRESGVEDAWPGAAVPFHPEALYRRTRQILRARRRTRGGQKLQKLESPNVREEEGSGFLKFRSTRSFRVTLHHQTIDDRCSDGSRRRMKVKAKIYYHGFILKCEPPSEIDGTKGCGGSEQLFTCWQRNEIRSAAIELVSARLLQSSSTLVWIHYPDEEAGPAQNHDPFNGYKARCPRLLQQITDTGVVSKSTPFISPPPKRSNNGSPGTENNGREEIT